MCDLGIPAASADATAPATGFAFTSNVPACDAAYQDAHHLSLSDVRYRNSLLTITVTGQGTRVKRFLLDGKPQKQAFFDGSLTGSHTIAIQLAA